MELTIMLTNAEKIKYVKPERYRQVFCVDKPIFDLMLETLDEQSVKEGKIIRKISTLDKLIMFLEYWYEGRITEVIGANYGLTKSNVSIIANWVEGALRQNPTIVLPAKRKWDEQLIAKSMMTEDGHFYIKTSKI